MLRVFSLFRTAIALEVTTSARAVRKLLRCTRVDCWCSKVAAPRKKEAQVAGVDRSLLGTQQLWLLKSLRHPLRQEHAATVVILHGLLGQGKNWRTFAKKLATAATKESGKPWQVITLDLRCHGQSAASPFEAPHTMKSAAADVVHFVQKRLGSAGAEVVCGHSLGGKVAIEYCVQASAESSTVRRPAHVWVLDSQPGAVPQDTVPDVSRVLQAVQAAQVPIASREELYSSLAEQNFSSELIQWMGSNLVPVPGDPAGRLRWAFDTKGAAALYDSYCGTSYWPWLASPPPGVKLNILRAARSDRWDAPMMAKLDRCVKQSQGSSEAYVLEDAGHWVHMDKPLELQRMVLESVKAVSANM